jgi:hypothetical protein
MHQIQLADDIYDLAKRRADEAGFESVDDYIVDLLDDDGEAYEDTPNLDHLFTPERLAELDRISAEVKAGGPTYTVEEVWEHLAEYRAEWIRKNSK